jgi:hypothetical protein
VAGRKEKEKRNPQEKQPNIEDGKTKSGRNPPGYASRMNRNEQERSKCACDQAQTQVQKKLETKLKTHITV